MTEINYTTIDSPYNDNMERQSDNDNTLFTNVQPSTGMGSINNISSPNQISGNVISGSTLDNLWLKSWLKSQNYLPGANGFLIDGISGDVEFGNGKFRGDITGASGTFSGTISGGSISIGTTPNWFKVDALGNIWSGQNTLALAQTNTFAVTNAGSLYAMNGTIAGTLTIGGRLATIVGGAINADGDFINELINTKLDTSAETILGDFTFGESGAIKMITDDDNGLWISPTGILGKTGGVNTISIGVDGSANFAGTLTAAAGTLGSITAGTFTGISIAIGSINNIFKADANGIYLGNATFASAPFNVTMAGALTATSATITGAITISSGSGIANLSDAGGLATMDESEIDQTALLNSADAGADVTQTKIDGGLITTGYITLSTAGNIKSGQTAYATGNGWWLGDDSGTPKFSIGTSTKYMKWDGTNLTINGGAFATGCSWTGNEIASTYIGDLSADKITTGTLNASNVTISNLTVGTNVAIGTAVTSAGVTTIVGNTITTSYLNAKAITTVGAVTGGSITGILMQTSSSATTGVKISSALGGIRIYGETLSVYYGSTQYGSIGGDGAYFNFASTNNRNVRFVTGSGSVFINGAAIAGATSGATSCGLSSQYWSNVYTNNLTLDSSKYLNVTGGRITSSADLVATGSLHATGNVYTGGLTGHAGSVNAAMLYLHPSTTSPSSYGQIRNYASAVDQFRGVPGNGSWAGSFDMSAY